MLEDMNLSFVQPVARASVGGRGGGGAVLTPFGERLVGRYRKLESEEKGHPWRLIPAEAGTSNAPTMHAGR